MMEDLFGKFAMFYNVVVGISHWRLGISHSPWSLNPEDFILVFNVKRIK
jgi:hypothetical protein